MSQQRSTTIEPLLTVTALHKSFGGVEALRDYHLAIESGSLVGLIGPNGAGKTTVFNLLSGVLSPTSGNIVFQGKDITAQKPHLRAREGLTRTFQNIRLFEGLSVHDNVKIALHMHHGKGIPQTLLHNRSYRLGEREIAERADELLELFNITSWRNELAGMLPYGIQRSVEIARALATEPRLLLLDEPVAGLNPSETETFVELIESIHRSHDFAILLVEHDMKVIMRMCSHIQVLDQGVLIAEGNPEEIQNNSQVIKAYLGYEGTERDETHPTER
jgi:branched-chain amino acid transport system ATP-binding protein